MALDHPAWVVHQRRRFLRPDAERYVRPDAARQLRSDDLSAPLVSHKQAEALSRKNAASFQCELCQLAISNQELHRRFAELKLDRLRDYIARKYRVDQPRVPNPEGGQWPNDGGAGGRNYHRIISDADLEGPKPGAQAATTSGNPVLDHQPPTALNYSGRAQRLYPQCLTCGLQQGNWISRYGRKR